MAKVAKIKTQATEESVADFLSTIEDDQKRKDCELLVKMMETASGEPAKMWGKSMVGFGLKRYKSPASGREVDWFKIGFSPRKSNISLHLVLDIKAQSAQLEKLGKHKTGVGCLYIQRLADVDEKILAELIKQGMKDK